MQLHYPSIQAIQQQTLQLDHEQCRHCKQRQQLVSHGFIHRKRVAALPAVPAVELRPIMADLMKYEVIAVDEGQFVSLSELLFQNGLGCLEADHGCWGPEAS